MSDTLIIQEPREPTREELQEIAREASRGHDHREMARTLVEVALSQYLPREGLTASAQLTL